jgi:predicted DNA-binding ribbon-helix-helix protein
LPGAATASAQARLSEITKPEFRTLSIGGGRTGVRLEKVFWQALDALSRDVGQKRTRFVSQIVEDANQLDINATGAIRSTTVDLLLREVERLRPLAQISAMVSLLQAGPAPAFALDQRKRLVQSNPEFLRYLRSVAGSPGAVADAAQLSMERPLDGLFKDLVAGQTTECGISIRSGNRERRTTARILMVPPAPAKVLVGYILS